MFSGSFASKHRRECLLHVTLATAPASSCCEQEPWRQIFLQKLCENVAAVAAGPVFSLYKQQQPARESENERLQIDDSHSNQTF